MPESEIRALFAGVRHRRYFNAAAAALTPTPVAEAVQRAAMHQMENGIHSFPEDMVAVEAAHDLAARRIGAERAADVTLVSSTADALARVAGDVARTVAAGDFIATGATLFRLMRVGERSLTAVWDLQDLSV